MLTHLATLRACALIAALAACLAAGQVMSTGSAGAATSGTVVGATVPSATSLNATGCGPLVANRTHFGTVLPGSSNVTSLDCSVVFGSSNDTASLRMYQTDLGGVAFTRYATSVDTAWGTGGYVRSDLGSDEDDVQALVVQPDGKVVVGGKRNGDWFVARYNVNGSLDTAGFNSPTGYRTLALSAGTAEVVQDLVLQPDGAIVAVGAANGQLGVARFTSAGLLDTAGFGAGAGFTRTNIASVAGEQLNGVALQPSGRIVANGAGNSTNQDLIIGYTAAGIVDTTFSAPDGYGVADVVDDASTDIVVDSAGRSYVAVYGYCGCEPRIARFSAAGVLDPSWGSAGVVTVPRASFDPGSGSASVQQIAFDPSGNLVVAGGADVGGNYELTLARITPLGVLDPTFAGDGTMYVASPGTQEAEEVVLLPDGSVMAFSSDGSVLQQVRGVRVRPNGTIDTNFGSGGSVTFGPPYATGGGTLVGGLVALADGSFMIAATTQTSGTWDVTLARFGGTPVADYLNGGGGGDTDWSGGANTFGACLRDATAGATTDAGTWVEDPDNDCADGDTDPWKAVAATPASPGSTIADSPLGVSSGVANLRWGFRSTSSQAAGEYTAAVSFDVLAPGT